MDNNLFLKMQRAGFCRYTKSNEDLQALEDEDEDEDEDVEKRANFHARNRGKAGFRRYTKSDEDLAMEDAAAVELGEDKRANYHASRGKARGGRRYQIVTKVKSVTQKSNFFIIWYDQSGEIMQGDCIEV